MEKKGQTTGNSGNIFYVFFLFFLFLLFYSLLLYFENPNHKNMTNIISLQEVAKHNTKGKLAISFNCNSCNIDVKNKMTTWTQVVY